ncbi:MAG: prolyl oligopeptidase family serine peptidase [Chloroflexota bacterium]|nr:prolyl oligopeptidase family serine peptidase [Chloroflexota bacterium]
MTDWRDRFRARTVLWTAPATADRRHALAAANRSGVVQLYGWQVGTDRLVQLTERPAGTVEGTISADGRWVHYVDDRAGDELGHWMRLPFTGGDPLDLTPGLPRYASSDLVTTADGRRLAFTAAHDDNFVVYVVDGEAEPRAVYRNLHTCWLAGWTAAGDRLALLTSERTGRARYALVIVDAASGDRVAELWDGPESSISNVHFAPTTGDGRVALATDVGGSNRPVIWEPASGARQAIDVAGEGEVVPWDWAPDGHSILLSRVAGAVQELYVYDAAADKARRLNHPTGTFGFWGETGCWFTAEGNLVVQWQDSTRPSTTILLDGQSGELIRPLLEPTPVPASRRWRSVTFIVDGDQPIQAWLATPEGSAPFPAVIETHGGPEAVTMETFAPRAQAWLDHGFAFLTINYRGSTTFGRAFKEAIWGRPGELEVRDIVAARAWLVEHGIARPDEVFVTGWSYGGFLTLQSLGTAAGLWAGGMAGVAVADWVSEYEDENDMLRAYDRALFGGPPDEHYIDAYRRASPLTYAEQVDAPVLIIQGRNDTRCPARQVELYEARLRELGKPIEVIWFDAGHAAYADVERLIGFQERMLEFAQRVLRERREAPSPAPA